jgi:hypothetical protein
MWKDSVSPFPKSLEFGKFTIQVYNGLDCVLVHGTLAWDCQTQAAWVNPGN